jgi:hypothetical protein
LSPIAAIFECRPLLFNTLIIPFPVTRLGKYASGCRDTILGTPCVINSIISVVSNQSSPILLRNYTMASTAFSASQMDTGAMSPLHALTDLFIRYLYSSVNQTRKQEIQFW